MTMKSAVLCNGPSRILFKNPEQYDYIIGCNIPWTTVHSTVVLDVDVIKYWIKNKLPIIPLWFSESAWRETENKDRQLFVNSFLGIVKPLSEYYSSGHAACAKVIELGATQIDIYGCDSWFNKTLESSTHEYVNTSGDTSKHIDGWRNKWNLIIENNPDVKINFIGEIK
jgi:hypothetical protein